jgi:hypothetical protein
VYPDWRKAQERSLASLEGLEWSETLQALGTAARSAK